MSLIAIIEKIAGKISFPTEEEKTALHEQIHALADDAVTDVKTLVHGVESDAVSTPAVVGGEVEDADPLAGFSATELEAEIAKRQAQQ